MKKLFGLFLLALAFLTPSAAQAVGCFWVGGAATWDTTNTGGGGAGGIKWASASGGTTACAGGGTGGSPSSGDTATFDASSGTGTVTVNFGGLITLVSLDMSNFNGTLDFATFNNSITLTLSGSAFFSSSSVARTLNMGSGTWTLSGANGSWNSNTATNFTLVPGTSTLAFTGSGTRALLGGGKTFNNVTVAASNGTTGHFKADTSLFGAASLSVAAPNSLLFRNATFPITAFSTSGGSLSSVVALMSSDPVNGSTTISSASPITVSWLALSATIWSGGGTFTANSSFNLYNNSGITINAPTGGGGGGRIIGG